MRTTLAAAWAALAAFFITPAYAALDLGDIICETSTTTGTGTLNLAGAVTNYATFVSQIASGAQTAYHITASDGKLETGYGVFTDATPDTLSRVANWSTDGSGAELTLPAGTHTVCVGPTAPLFNSGAGLSTPHTSFAFQLDSDGTPLTALTLGGTSDIATYGAITNFGDNSYSTFELTNTSADVGGPGIFFYHNSASPADGDEVSWMSFSGEDSGGATQAYASWSIFSTDVTATTEDGQAVFYVMYDGASTDAMTLSEGAIAFNIGSPGAGFGTVRFVATEARPLFALAQLADTTGTTGLKGKFEFTSDDDAGNESSFAAFNLNVTDATNGSEDGAMQLTLATAGNPDVVAFSVGALSDNSNIFYDTANNNFGIDDDTVLTFYEADANGDNFQRFDPPASITADATCTFENDANFIPDSCVGDGSDASDARLKDVIGPAGDVGGIIDGIKIYDYTWNRDLPEISEDVRKGKRGFGPVAQELYEVLPDAVHVGGPENTDPWTWKPEKVVPYLIVETQHLRNRVAALEAATPTCYGIKLGSACVGVSM
jgi:hypothetical protein